jgi:L-Lysine epsilon oxidase N-terminal
MSSSLSPKFRIYPSIGIARLGNGPAEKDQVIFSPEIPWENLYDTDKNYLTEDGKIKKQAQRFYIYECDEKGVPVKQADPAAYSIKWTAEVANKKPFWYDFNNSLDLSILSENRNLSPDFAIHKLAPGIGAAQRNLNVLDEGKRLEGGYNFRKELINRPGAVTVDESNGKQVISGQFPFTETGKSLLAGRLKTSAETVDLGTVEYDNGTP